MLDQVTRGRFFFCDSWVVSLAHHKSLGPHETLDSALCMVKIYPT
jgi:hypothetical protein